MAVVDAVLDRIQFVRAKQFQFNCTLNRLQIAQQLSFQL